MSLDDAIDRLLKARKRLKDDQGRIARRNARQNALRALRQARAALDVEYPSIAKPRRKARKAKPRGARLRNMSRLGTGQALRLIEAGMSRNQFEFIDTKDVYAATWITRAMRAKIGVKLIVEAVRSQKKRRQINATLRLKGTP
jgi:hypothetical protein